MNSDGNMGSKNSNHLKDGFIDFTSGSLGGVALVYVGQPLDTVKVKMQTFPLVYTNMVDCVKTTLLSDGLFRGLYAGTVPALVCNVAENSVLFFSYGFCQKLMQNISRVEHLDHLSTLNNATAGSLAAFFASFAICPTELIKCRLQAMSETHKSASSTSELQVRLGPGQLVRQILRLEGVMGLFRGFTPTVAREMPGYFFFFGGYEGTRELLRRPGQSKDDIGLSKTMLAGGFGGALFWTLTFPIDVAKSRIQISSSNENLVNCIIKIFRQEGISTLYHGLAPTLVRTIPATAALFATYEYSKKILNYILNDF